MRASRLFATQFRSKLFPYLHAFPIPSLPQLLRSSEGHVAGSATVPRVTRFGVHLDSIVEVDAHETAPTLIGHHCNQIPASIPCGSTEQAGMPPIFFFSSRRESSEASLESQSPFQIALANFLAVPNSMG